MYKENIGIVDDEIMINFYLNKKSVFYEEEKN